MTHEPILLRSAAEFSATCDNARGEGKTVALVPTMGALHEGHLTLVDRAREAGDLVAVTIFVNPTQFGPGEDLDRYPRDLDGDLAKLAGRGTDVVFAPRPMDMYPPGSSTSVVVDGLTNGLCGALRPGHFAGVATIVAKLLNIVGPCTAVFGRKDYQQLQVIRRMAGDLNMPVNIIGAPTVREPDGLAMSSRNAYLSGEQRARALAIPGGITRAHLLFSEGERRVRPLREAVLEPVSREFDSIDYVTAADPDTLAPLGDDDIAPARMLLAVAARVGSTRLIDNTVLGEDEPPGVERSR